MKGRIYQIRLSGLKLVNQAPSQNMWGRICRGGLRSACGDGKAYGKTGRIDFRRWDDDGVGI